MQGNLSIERMCQLARVSRAGFYRWLQGRGAGGRGDGSARRRFSRSALEHKRRYGYRRVSKELRRRGMLVNHKRVARLMREDNLLASSRRAFVVTTDSDHELEVYLNLARRMKLTGINQLWVADITYIRLQTELVYLAVVLDAFSRKVVGWELGRSLAARLPMSALEQAIAERQPPPGWCIIPIAAVQYASGEYVGRAAKHGMMPSMSRPANPYDNASCESFMQHSQAGRDLRQYITAIWKTSALNIEEFIDSYYNRMRLHSALGYRPPEEFEQSCANAATWSQGAAMSFFRHEEIYRSDVEFFRQKLGAARLRSLAHRLDESPAGYSLAGCSPAEPASASPANDYSEGERKFEKEKSMNGKCANRRLSQRRGSPHSAVPKLCPNSHLLQALGLLFERKQIPQIVVNVRIQRKTMEPLEATRLPWAQGVGRSNRPAPTKFFGHAKI